MIRLLGYTYDSGHHCIDCTDEYIKQAYLDMDKVYTMDGYTQEELVENMLDSESNSLHLIYDIDEALGDNYCDDCDEIIQECNFVTEDHFKELFNDEDFYLYRSYMTDGSLILEFWLEGTLLKLAERDSSNMYFEHEMMYHRIRDELKFEILKNMYESHVNIGQERMYVNIPLLISKP